MGAYAVSRPIQLGLDCCMPLNRFPTFRTRLSLGALKIFARLAYQNQGRRFTGYGQNESVSRILVLELWNIGDVILAMPFLAQLRCLFPRAQITLVSRPFAVDLLAGTGLVDTFIPAELTWTPIDRTLLPTKAISLWRVSRKLRAQRFDLGFSARRHLREHILLALSGARRRLGLSLGSGAGALTDAFEVGNAQRHRVEEWMRLLAPFGSASSVLAPRLHVEEQERLWAKGYLTSKGVTRDELLIGIHPGASLAEKRWPLGQFREVALATASEPRVRVLAFADPSGYGAELFAIPRVVGAHVGLRGLIALIERCDLLVCNDSGPMHIAGALGVPTVAMFGSGIEEWFAPVGEGHEMLHPHPNARLPVLLSPEEGVRSPIGIRSSQVLDAVDRAVQRFRARGRFSRA